MDSSQERKNARATSSAVPAHIDLDGIGLDDIHAFDAFCKRYPDIANEARLRWWIFHRKSNGIEKSGAVVKRAGRWYVVVPRMKNWILEAA
jgi:hypothetical protein